MGSQFDSSGNVYDWWAPDAKNNFSNKTKCFVSQYSKYEDKELGQRVNGNLTLGENVADAGGLKISYKVLFSLSSLVTISFRLSNVLLTNKQNSQDSRNSLQINCSIYHLQR